MPNLYICIDRFLDLNQINIQQQQQKTFMSLPHELGKKESERSTWKT